MPEYLAPGVYVEEVSFRSKSIEGVSTTTTGFIGPCAYGPVELGSEPEIVTSLEEFERMYGPGDQLRFGPEDPPTMMHNYMWHAVRAFFAEGGRRLYIARVFLPRADDDDGRARGIIDAPGGQGDEGILVRARFPGRAGDMTVRFTFRLGPNVLFRDPETNLAAVGGLAEHDVVWIDNPLLPPGSPMEGGDFALAAQDDDGNWRFEGSGNPVALGTLAVGVDQVRPVILTVSTLPTGAGALPRSWEVGLDSRRVRNGQQDSMFNLFGETPATPGQALSLPIIVARQIPLNGLQVLNAIFAAAAALPETDPQQNLRANLVAPILPRLPGSPWGYRATSDLERSFDLRLQGGNDGARPEAGEYEGRVDPNTDRRTGLKIFEDLEDISIVAAPGSTRGYTGDYNDDARTIARHLINHANLMRYRIVVLDSGEDLSISDVRNQRAELNSKYAAFYYPWVRVLDPITREPIFLPPSGFVCGIYARNDNLRAVYKAPANEVVNLSLGFERLINKAQHEVLNPEGVNCFRFFEGRGYLLWGARMATDDPEWKYVNLRRYFAYLERSIDIGTQWAVFEPNGPELWANVTRTIESFLLNEWVNGALLGEKPDKAFFVRCDRSTMTQNDLDNGRLVCLIGVAPLRPAEFVIFRIGQWTGDARR